MLKSMSHWHRWPLNLARWEQVWWTHTLSGSNAEVGDSVVGAGKLQREPEPWWVGKTGPAHTEGTSLYSMNDMAKVQGQRRACLSVEHHLTSGCLGGRKRPERQPGQTWRLNVLNVSGKHEDAVSCRKSQRPENEWLSTEKDSGLGLEGPRIPTTCYCMILVS